MNKNTKEYMMMKMMAHSANINNFKAIRNNLLWSTGATIGHDRTRNDDILRLDEKIQREYKLYDECVEQYSKIK